MTNTGEPRSRKDRGSKMDDESRFDMLTQTYLARDRAGPPEPSSAMLPAGSVLGPYRIVALIGRGGMGVVYEAEEIEDGRRVALKVLSPERRRDVDRERFHREGRLAASLNHPRCVYIFGAWEIDGDLVIAMELMRETLADWRRREGQLGVAAAVDAILDVTAGLEAAAHAGILHRDVKPSNCFVDDEGRVKIGDFGISISAHVSEEPTARSTRQRIVGTPAYASPEQLRGRTLDARSDIYGVGATLYELVTGHVPFVRADLMALLMAVANDPPVAPHRIGHAIPHGLSQIILRCLAKKPDQRYDSYAELAAALEHYSSAAPNAAALSRRAVAGIIDAAILSLPLIVFNIGPLLADSRAGAVLSSLTSRFAGFLMAWGYFTAFEGVWGASPGKALSGLVVVGATGLPARLPLIVARAALCAAWLLSIRLISSADPPSLERVLPGPLAFLALQTAALLPLALLFSTARRGNGLAGLHDLLTGTRVVERRVQRDRPERGPAPSPPTRDAIGRAGPYQVLPDPVRGLGDRWRWGFDPRLRRPVWIRFCTPQTPPVPPARRALTRRTRLRWLGGRRAEGDAWDAYESVDGVPALDIAPNAARWADVRWWLLDVARECAAMTPADRAPRDPQRIWVLASGVAKWLDDPVADAVVRDSVATDRQLLAAIARNTVASERGRDEGSSTRQPVPLGARRFLDRLETVPSEDVADVVPELELLTRQRAVLTRTWRLLPIAILALALAVPLAVDAVRQTSASVIRNRVPLDQRVAAAALSELFLANHRWLAMSSDDRTALEVALATRYREVLADGRLFAPPAADYLRLGDEHRAIALDALRRHPPAALDPQEGMAPRVAAIVRRVNPDTTLPWYQAVHVRTISGYAVFAIVALIVGVVFRGGLLRIFGLEIVTARGQPARRFRVLARAVLIWSPLLLVPWVTPVLGRILPDLAATPWWLLAMLGGAIAVAINPARGVQDRLAGTWVVPR
jgi:serine/threonine protein kinase